MVILHAVRFSFSNALFLCLHLLNPLEYYLFLSQTLWASCLVYRLSEVVCCNWFALLKACYKTRTQTIELMLLFSVAIITKRHCSPHFYWLLGPVRHTPSASLLCGGIIMPGISGVSER